MARVAAADPWLREHPPEIEWGVGGVSFPPSEVAVRSSARDRALRAPSAPSRTSRGSAASRRSPTSRGWRRPACRRALRARGLRAGALLGRVRRRRRAGRGRGGGGTRGLRLVRRGMRTSAFCFAGDLADEGLDAVLDDIQDRAGLGGVTMAAAYHASRDVFPHARTPPAALPAGRRDLLPAGSRALAGPGAAAAPGALTRERRSARRRSSPRPARAASACRRGRCSCTSTGPRTAIRASPSRRASAIPA